MTFNGKIFQQIQGTAMGKQHAPPYANLVIAYLVIFKLYPKLELKYGKSCCDHIEQFLKLYLDDDTTMVAQEAQAIFSFFSYINTFFM